MRAISGVEDLTFGEYNCRQREHCAEHAKGLPRDAFWETRWLSDQPDPRGLKVGLCADSGEKHEPARYINAAVTDRSESA